MCDAKKPAPHRTLTRPATTVYFHPNAEMIHPTHKVHCSKTDVNGSLNKAFIALGIGATLLIIDAVWAESRFQCPELPFPMHAAWHCLATGALYVIISTYSKAEEALDKK